MIQGDFLALNPLAKFGKNSLQFSGQMSRIEKLGVCQNFDLFSTRNSYQ